MIGPHPYLVRPVALGTAILAPPKGWEATNCQPAVEESLPFGLNSEPMGQGDRVQRGIRYLLYIRHVGSSKALLTTHGNGIKDGDIVDGAYILNTMSAQCHGLEAHTNEVE